MTAHTIRVQVNPADADEYVIYADAGDTDGQRWLGQRTGDTRVSPLGVLTTPQHRQTFATRWRARRGGCWAAVS